MAYPDLVGIDFRDISDVAAMAPTVDLHKSLLQVFSRRYVYVSARREPHTGLSAFPELQYVGDPVNRLVGRQRSLCATRLFRPVPLRASDGTVLNHWTMAQT